MKSSKFANFERIPFNDSLLLSTLGDNTVLTVAIGPTLSENFRVTSVECWWTIRDLTGGEGPLQVGYNHQDYSVSEINEALNAVFTNRGSKIEREQANRLVRTVGQFTGLSESETLNDGKSLKTKLNWALDGSGAIEAFVCNRSGATLTTGASLELNGYINGKWT